jgi:hypothetical protein
MNNNARWHARDPRTLFDRGTRHFEKRWQDPKRIAPSQHNLCSDGKNNPKPSLHIAAKDMKDSSGSSSRLTSSYRYQYKPAFRALAQDRTSFRAWNATYQPKVLLGSDIHSPAAAAAVASCQKATKGADRSHSLDIKLSAQNERMVRGDGVIQVLPGVALRLCGASETWMAIQNGWYTQCTCPCCSLAMLCVDSADFVICPDCRVVSPVQGCDMETSKQVESCGIVGLGLRHDMLPNDHFRHDHARSPAIHHERRN